MPKEKLKMGNEKLDINVDSLKVLLRDFESRKKRVGKLLMERIYEISDTDCNIDYINAVAYKKNILNGMPRSSGGDLKDLSDVVARYQKTMRHRSYEITQSIAELAWEEEALRQVWNCYQSLDGDEYDIITRLYVKGEEYEEVRQAFPYSLKKFENIRRSALRKIVKRYQLQKA